MTDALITVGYFFAALFPLVLIHELGHFLLAKANGIRVDEFGIGFPPRLVRVFRLGETDYTLNLLPLGGFVRLAGENEPDMPGAFAAAGKMARAAVLFAGPVFNFLLAAILLAGIALSQGAPEPVAPQDAVMVLQVAPKSAAEAAGIQDGDVVIAIDGVPLREGAAAAGLSGDGETAAGMQLLMDTTDSSAGQALTLTVLRGVEETLETRAPDTAADLRVADANIDGLVALRVLDQGGAEALAAGDLVIGPRDVVSGAAEPAGQTLVVLRGAAMEMLPLVVTPSAEGRIGVSISSLSVLRRVAALDAPAYGARRTVAVMGTMVSMLGQMVVGQQDAELAGPVGIARMGREFGERSTSDFLAFMALLSINLGIINLIPIPGLDGGRLVFVALEALRGRRLASGREEIVNFIGIALVIGLMVAITVYEVFGPRLIGRP